uniref:peptidylprolyl isomerase n=1 Tax=Brassica oleracea var. oleracea TaxID=109376 RepID=A0A0D3C361_BRAOL
MASLMFSFFFLSLSLFLSLVYINLGTPGKTPNIPREILLEILGYSKVYRQVIKKLINSAIEDYVKQEDLKVGKELSVEQSYEDLEETFEPGESFSFDATIKLQESS